MLRQIQSLITGRAEDGWIRMRERGQTAAREWGVWEQTINKRNETLWFIEEEGRRVGPWRLWTWWAGSVLLLSLFYSVTSIISPAPSPHSSASQLKPTPAGKAEGRSIFYESSSARQTERHWWRQRQGRDRHRVKSSRLRNICFTSEFWQSVWMKTRPLKICS